MPPNSGPLPPTATATLVGPGGGPGALLASAWGHTLHQLLGPNPSLPEGRGAPSADKVSFSKSHGVVKVCNYFIYKYTFNTMK